MSDIFESIMGRLDKVLHPDGHPRVVGVYDSLDGCVEAIGRIRTAGFENLVIHSPVPSHEIEEAMNKGMSIIRYFTLFGAIAGGIGGFLLSSYASMRWNLAGFNELITGGKPVISIPAFLIITFECTILLGGIGTLVGFFYASRIPQPTMSDVYLESFGVDRFGVGIVCDENQLEKAEAALKTNGASEVYRAPS